MPIKVVVHEVIVLSLVWPVVILLAIFLKLVNRVVRRRLVRLFLRKAVYARVALNGCLPREAGRGVGLNLAPPDDRDRAAGAPAAFGTVILHAKG